ncbi:hypothetical protein COO59_01840 [Mixta theicola]|uniref:Inner membrane protein YbjM n=1 Tax=Mixta theicola TaxID=1458355 RepID=A0A2K1QEZ5_9GAMM|nr:inner membrane protein YbjM [Mixta theicola]PNS13579.1 hypothetical protein COO59_01840 [Mixta theicola]GLR09900.1 inner membrane protein YbjM [Mixta theicola]
MLLYSVRWPGVVFCMTLYCATFFLTRYGGAEDAPGNTSEQTGLLLFMLPGLVAALINRYTPLAQALLAAVAATPCCLLIGMSGGLISSAPLQELAWMTSAIFWCGFGALLVMLWRTLAASHITR